MRKGLFGGTFNPVHWGHVRLVQTLLSSFSLDQIIVVPTARPPHKDTGYIAAPDHRFHMVCLAFEKEPGVHISNLEMDRADRTYTIDTVKHFIAAEPDASFFLIMGLDSFLELDTWKAYMALVENIPLIVFTRTLDQAAEKAAFESFLKTRVSDQYLFSADRACYTHPFLCPVFFYTAHHFNISATDIRRRIKAGLPINMLVPESVAHYIQEKGLYA